jgi:hypothetical protein
MAEDGGQYVSSDDKIAEAAGIGSQPQRKEPAARQFTPAAVDYAAATGHPIAFDPVTEVNTVTVTTSTYTKIVEWIPRPPGGVLKEVSMSQDPNANYRLVVSGKEMFKDKPLQAALTIDYERMRVPGGNDLPIQVFVKQSGATAPTVSAEINGEQER